jgi:hypothetical protein
MRLYASLALMRFIDEIPCFLAVEERWMLMRFLDGTTWCDVRTLERWMLKNAGDLV